MADETKPAPKRTPRTTTTRKAAPKAASAASSKRTTSRAKATEAPKTEAWREQASAIADQALSTARSAATTAKNSTGSALHGLSKLIGDTAGTVDGKLGPQYGDYARQAAESVAGAAKSLDEKDVDQIAAEARDFVRKSPAVAIGAAAIVGFVLMRLARGGSSDES